jgi:hypothetical protein
MGIPILAQPDDVTCGPTSLHAVYRHLGLDLPLEDVIRDVGTLEEGGTLGVLLGLDALRRGLQAHLHTSNLQIFDPTWLALDSPGLADHLEAQLQAKPSQRKLGQAIRAYLHFLEQGGTLDLRELTPAVIREYLEDDQPVLAGLSATYLYRSAREFTDESNRAVTDPILGEPVGHFVVLARMEHGQVLIADPYPHNPISGEHYYRVGLDRLVRAVLMGVVTYDGNLLVIRARES